jgi:hypothetical protein
MITITSATVFFLVAWVVAVVVLQLLAMSHENTDNPSLHH